MLFTCSIVLIFVLYIFYKKEQEKNKLAYYPLYQAIPFGNDIKLASELPKKEEEKEEDLEKGIKIFNFALAERRKK